jgi:serine/threonine-protein kinase RsbW
MATVELRFSALPAHVRTARLIAAAVARRSGVDESVMDEVRLAVGEACSRAVELHRQFCPDVPVEMRLSDDDARFEVVVHDSAPVEGTLGAGALEALEQEASRVGHDGGADDGIPDPLPPGVGLAVIGGLVDEVEVDAGGTGARVRMSWPADAAEPAGDGFPGAVPGSAPGEGRP